MYLHERYSSDPADFPDLRYILYKPVQQLDPETVQTLVGVHVLLRGFRILTVALWWQSSTTDFSTAATRWQ